MDADIALPPNTRDALERADPDPVMVYGIDRVECKSDVDWQRFIGNPERNVDGGGWFIHTTHSPFQLATRVSFGPDGGFIPIGFFQLWNPTAVGFAATQKGTMMPAARIPCSQPNGRDESAGLSRKSRLTVWNRRPHQWR